MENNDRRTWGRRAEDIKVREQLAEAISKLNELQTRLTERELLIAKLLKKEK
jgi:hypothetical protein